MIKFGFKVQTVQQLTGLFWKVKFGGHAIRIRVCSERLVVKTFAAWNGTGAEMHANALPLEVRWTIVVNLGNRVVCRYPIGRGVQSRSK